MLQVLLVLLLSARAEVPLPSYAGALGRSAWVEVNGLVERGRYQEAIAEAQRFEDTVVETAGLEYLIGLSYRFLDDSKRAERHLRRAVELDPEYHSPWSDLGEIYLVQGRFEEARECYAKLTELLPSGPGSALGPRRLAEIAAHQHDPEAFEAHIREALRRGFSFREIAGLPNWQKFYADPVMRDSVQKMITVYGDRSVLETLAPHTAEARPPE